MVHTVGVLGERLSHLENVSKAQRWPPPVVGTWVAVTMRRGTVSRGKRTQACVAAMPQGRLPASGADRLDKEGRPQAPKEREGWLFRRRRRNTA